MKPSVLLILVFLIAGSTASMAQLQLCKPGTDYRRGKVNFYNDAMLDTMMAQRVEKNLEPKIMRGFRVQIYFGSSREEALATRSHFLRQYPFEDAYLSYDQPYFRVRVGNFRTRSEAQPFFREMRGKFESVIIVPETVVIQRNDQ